MENRRNFPTLLEKAVAFHGHLCGGQLIGVRMAMLGLREIGINDPLGEDRKKLIVFVEIDRCATDAIMTVTGCRIGRRNMKVIDNGKMAATFINTETGKAVRIVSLADARQKAEKRYPELPAGEAQKKAYQEMADSDLFSVQDVAIRLPPEDLPDRPLGKEVCNVCGETILDCREVRRGDTVLCRTCATGKSYYRGLAQPRPPCKLRCCRGTR